MLGIDPGLTRCGMGTVNAGGARRMNLVDMRVVRSPAELAPHKCLLIIVDGLQKVIDAFRPDVVAVERVFVQPNVRSVTGTAQVAGIVMLAAAGAGLRLVIHTPSEVKAVATGNGHADKRQVRIIVQRILGLVSFPRPADAVDAVTIAIAHSWRGDTLSGKEPGRAQHGDAGTLPRATGGDLTPAQRVWAGTERVSRCHSAVAPAAKNDVQS